MVMFGLGKSKKKEDSESDQQKPQEKKEKNIQADVNVGQIRTMPDKFLSHHRAAGGKKDNWLIYIIVLVVVGILIVAAIFLFNRIVDSNSVTNNENQNATANTNENTNANANTNGNSNANTNSAVTIEELSDVLLLLDDLGDAYSDYDESDAEVDQAVISNIDTDRAQKWFTYEEVDGDNIAIAVITQEAASNSDAVAVYEINREKRDKMVERGEGEFQSHSQVGEDSFLFVNSNLNVIELGFYWKYMYSNILINIYQGVLTNWDDIEDWSATLLERMKQYDADRPTPANTNSNSNTNINSNSNSNSNTNSSSNSNININTNSNINITPPTRSKDTDGDGLTDVEEILYGTEAEKPDTDGDSYLDGNELKSGYSPIDATAKLIETTELVKVFNSQPYNYRILYPTPWLVQPTSFDGSSVVFTSSTTELVEILITDNTERLSPKQWYISQSPGIDAEDIEDVIVGDLVGVKSLDEMTYYLGEENVIYSITYNLVNREEASFFTTFEMMVNSFKLTGDPVGTNTNSNSNANANSNIDSGCPDGYCFNDNYNVDYSNTNSNSNSNTNTSVNANTENSYGLPPSLNDDSGYYL